ARRDRAAAGRARPEGGGARRDLRSLRPGALAGHEPRASAPRRGVPSRPARLELRWAPSLPYASRTARRGRSHEAAARRGRCLRSPAAVAKRAHCSAGAVGATLGEKLRCPRDGFWPEAVVLLKGVEPR